MYIMCVYNNLYKIYIRYRILLRWNCHRWMVATLASINRRAKLQGLSSSLLLDALCLLNVCMCMCVFMYVFCYWTSLFTVALGRASIQWSKSRALLFLTPSQSPVHTKESERKPFIDDDKEKENVYIWETKTVKFTSILMSLLLFFNSLYYICVYMYVYAFSIVRVCARLPPLFYRI